MRRKRQDRADVILKAPRIRADAITVLRLKDLRMAGSPSGSRDRSDARLNGRKNPSSVVAF
jgi:hypothetical protein